MKEKITGELQKQAEVNLGMSMTFTLFEWLKEAKDELLEAQPEEATLPAVSQVISDVGRLSVDEVTEVTAAIIYFVTLSLRDKKP